MGFIGKLFGSQGIVDAATEMVKAAPKALDKMAFTAEEKDDSAKEKYQLWLRLQEIIANENSAYAITRRLLAVMTFGYFLTVLTVAAGCFIAGIFVDDPDLRQRFVGAAGYLRQLAENQENLVLLVAAFYFGPGFLSKVKK